MGMVEETVLGKLHHPAMVMGIQPEIVPLLTFNSTWVPGLAAISTAMVAISGVLVPGVTFSSNG